VSVGIAIALDVVRLVVREQNQWRLRSPFKASLNRQGGERVLVWYDLVNAQRHEVCVHLTGTQLMVDVVIFDSMSSLCDSVVQSTTAKVETGYPSGCRRR
jgi:hypothetical protein